jgi:hypothetical protein
MIRPKDLDEIEGRFHIHLPRAYRECIALMDDLEPTIGEVFDTDLATLIEENESVRRNGFFGLDWPNHYFVLGGNGAGDLYYLDTTEQERPRVYQAGHERPTLRMEQVEFYRDSRLIIFFVAWRESYKNGLKGCNKPKSPRHWWQFWR